mgnify:CR=1 FL=1
MTDSLPGAAAPPQTAIGWPDAERARAFGRWFDELAPRHRLDRASLHLASADASARRYFRVLGPDGASFIVMDSPSAAMTPSARSHTGLPLYVVTDVPPVIFPVDPEMLTKKIQAEGVPPHS